MPRQKKQEPVEPVAKNDLNNASPNEHDHDEQLQLLIREIQETLRQAGFEEDVTYDDSLVLIGEEGDGDEVRLVTVSVGDRVIGTWMDDLSVHHVNRYVMLGAFQKALYAAIHMDLFSESWVYDPAFLWCNEWQTDNPDEVIVGNSLRQYLKAKIQGTPFWGIFDMRTDPSEDLFAACCAVLQRNDDDELTAWWLGVISRGPGSDPSSVFQGELLPLAFPQEEPKFADQIRGSWDLDDDQFDESEDPDAPLYPGMPKSMGIPNQLGLIYDHTKDGCFHLDCGSANGTCTLRGHNSPCEYLGGNQPNCSLYQSRPDGLVENQRKMGIWHGRKAT